METQKASKIYFRPKVLAVLGFGIASGFPYSLIAATLTQWLSEEGVERGSIGLFSLALLLYSLKPLWAWIIDGYPVPLLSRLVGHRRSWLIVAQALLVAAIFLLGSSTPGNGLFLTAIAAVFLGFASATQDIVIDAYRIEILKPEEMGAGAAMSQYGWRMGAFLAGYLVLRVADIYGWPVAYFATTLLLLTALIPAFLVGEPERHRAPTEDKGIADIGEKVIAPFVEFLKRRGALLILGFILLHKIGDTMANLMLRNLLVTLDFTKVEVADYDVAVGTVALLVGVAVGGFLYARMGVARVMLLSLFLMMISNLSFAGLALLGHSTSFLAFTIGFENFASGIGGVAVVGYLSSLCNLAYTASQYALLSAASAVMGRLLTAPSGYLIDAVGFPVFYLLTTLAAVPGIVLFMFMMKHGFLGLTPEAEEKQ